MMTRPASSDPDPSPTLRASGWLAVATVVLTIVTFAFAITAIPDAGPHCAKDCVDYPYTSEKIAEQFPGDYLWLVPAMVLMLAFVAFVAAIHELAPTSKRLASLVGLVVAALATGVLVVDYFVQLTVLQPSLEKGQLEGWAMLTQYNPNGVFIALEELGYLLMSLALACLIPALGRDTRLDRAILWVFGIGFVSTIGSLVAVSAMHGIDRQDRFEVPAISIVWLTLLVGGSLYAISARRRVAGR